MHKNGGYIYLQLWAMGRAGRQRVEDEFRIERSAARMAALFKGEEPA